MSQKDQGIFHDSNEYLTYESSVAREYQKRQQKLGGGEVNDSNGFSTALKWSLLLP
jgi:hypothetical protein